MALIDVRTLAQRLAEADPPTLIDVRWRLGGPPGSDAYREGHIPGAAFLDLDAELCGVPGTGGRHPLPNPADLQVALRRVGVRQGHPVVAYDAGDGQAAARLWWTLRWAGHPQVEVLDGGFAAWTGAGQPVEPGTVDPPEGDIVVRPHARPEGEPAVLGLDGELAVLDPNGAVGVLDADDVALLARDGILIDARVPERFRGEMEPIDPVAGHIPGAVNLPAAHLVQPDGRLRPAEELAEVFAAVGVSPGTPVGAYCGSGVTAAQTVLALHLAGIEAALYVGSWSNWVADPSRRIGRGDRS